MRPTLLFLLFCVVGLVLAHFLFQFKSGAIEKNKEILQKEIFSIEDAPSETLRGEITTLSGEVFWQSRIATQAAPLKKPRTIQQGEELRTGKDGTVSLSFANGPTLTLFPNTHINVIQTLPNSIVLLQDEGSVTYQIAKSVSVLNLDLLTVMKEGEMTITIGPEGEDVQTKILKGQATIAHNDAEKVTTVTPISAGQTFIFDQVASVGRVQ